MSHLYVLLGEVSTQTLCPFFNQIVCLPGVESNECFCILDIRQLSDVSLTNMFLYTVGSLFILMMFSLAVQKLSNLRYSQLFSFSFISLALGDILAIHIAMWDIRNFPACVFL